MSRLAGSYCSVSPKVDLRAPQKGGVPLKWDSSRRPGRADAETVDQAGVRVRRPLLRGHALPVPRVVRRSGVASGAVPEAASDRPPVSFASSARPPAGASRSGTATARPARPPARGCGHGLAPSRRWRSVAGGAVVPRERLARRAPAARGARTRQADGVRAPPVAGVLLTDAEIDHTAGLLLLRESQAPVRVFGGRGVEQALRRGYPVLEILERYCGAEWQTLEPERGRRRSRGRASRSSPSR